MPKVIEVDGILRGHTDYEKLPFLYSRLKKEILPQFPIQKSPNNLVFISPNYGGEKSGSYEWELYNVDNGLIFLEAFGSWDGHGLRTQPRIQGGQKQHGMVYHWYGLRLTLHPENPDLENRINEIVSEFPRESKKAS